MRPWTVVRVLLPLSFDSIPFLQLVTSFMGMVLVSTRFGSMAGLACFPDSFFGEALHITLQAAANGSHKAYIVAFKSPLYRSPCPCSNHHEVFFTRTVPTRTPCSGFSYSFLPHVGKTHLFTPEHSLGPPLNCLAWLIGVLQNILATIPLVWNSPRPSA